jgi:hypothetical protein
VVEIEARDGWLTALPGYRHLAHPIILQ